MYDVMGGIHFLVPLILTWKLANYTCFQVLGCKALSFSSDGSVLWVSSHCQFLFLELPINTVFSVIGPNTFTYVLSLSHTHIFHCLWIPSVQLACNITGFSSGAIKIACIYYSNGPFHLGIPLLLPLPKPWSYALQLLHIFGSRTIHVSFPVLHSTL